MEPSRKSTLPAESISTRDRSRRSSSPRLTAALEPFNGLSKASRWLSRAALPLLSTRMALEAPSARVIRSLAFRCRVPRLSTELLESNTPACSTSRPLRLISPVAACTRPLLRTRPALLSAAKPGSTSLPRVVEVRLPSVPWPRRMTKLSPADRTVCPFGVTMLPALSTSLPSSRT